MEEGQDLLRRARERARYSQEDVAAALGVSRALVSYWETGSRQPNHRQISALARLYGMDLMALLEDSDTGDQRTGLAGMLLRATERVAPESAQGLLEFLQFLDRYAELSQLVDDPIRGLRESPFIHRARFSSGEDARRKAEEVRAHLGLGIGPIRDLDAVCEMLGITMYKAPLGADLASAPSGAFVKHPEVGFAILINLDMTPGRRRFTAAHEIAHALFHSDDVPYVVSRERNPLETFADKFAGEFLMPNEGVRRFMEEAGMPPQIVDPVDAVHIQRYFNSSFPTTLVRLRQMNVLPFAKYQEFKTSVRPLAYARALGYSIDREEYEQDPELWRIRKFPRPFLRRLREAVSQGLISPPTAASFSGMALPDMVHVLGDPLIDTKDAGDTSAEFEEYEVTGVI